MENYNQKTRASYREFLKGKRVVLVGPAPSILDTSQGADIDAFDVVVRLNKALPLPEHLLKDIGTRTDVLYNCMNPGDECGGKIVFDVLKKNKVKYLVGAYPPLEELGSTRLRLKKDLESFYSNNRLKLIDIKFCYFNNINYFNQLWSIMKLPNTGVMAILDLLKHDIAELYITGITFFKGGYIQDYRPYTEAGVLDRMKQYNLHHPDRQLSYMADRLLNSKRCVLDLALSDILKSEKSEKKLKSSEKKHKTKVKAVEIEEVSSELEETGYTSEMLVRITRCKVVLWKGDKALSPSDPLRLASAKGTSLVPF